MPTRDRSSVAPPVHIVGGGPAGLAAAAELSRRGIRAVVLERGPDVGTSWRRHYDCLRLHTTRRWSALPGLPIPRSAGRWVGRDDFVRYLEQYARHHRLDLAAGVEVSRLDPQPGGDGWRISANGGRELHAASVVIATGYNHTPRLPHWPGQDGFTGDLLHASAYRGHEPYADRDVLVVGVGNTGADIAADLTRSAARVRLAVRTPPHIVRRATLGWPSQANGIVAQRLPVTVGDRVSRAATGLLPDLSRHGLPRPEAGLCTRARQGAIPVQDTGLVRAIRRGQVEPVGAVTALDGPDVQLADGTTARPDVIIVATGYHRGLEPLVGHLGVLDGDGLPVVHGADTHPQAPGLRFTGYTSTLGGILREISRGAPRLASAIAAELETP